jgi:hypothetical protein
MLLVTPSQRRRPDASSRRFASQHRTRQQRALKWVPSTEKEVNHMPAKKKAAKKPAAKKKAAKKK